MKIYLSCVKKPTREEDAAEVKELGIVLALLVAGSVATIILIGPKVTQYFSNLNSSLP